MLQVLVRLVSQLRWEARPSEPTGIFWYKISVILQKISARLLVFHWQNFVQNVSWSAIHLMVWTAFALIFFAQESHKAKAEKTPSVIPHRDLSRHARGLNWDEQQLKYLMSCGHDRWAADIVCTLLLHALRGAIPDIWLLGWRSVLLLLHYWGRVWSFAWLSCSDMFLPRLLVHVILVCTRGAISPRGYCYAAWLHTCCSSTCNHWSCSLLHAARLARSKSITLGRRTRACFIGFHCVSSCINACIVAYCYMRL